MINPEKLAT